MAKTATATQVIERGMALLGSRASSARFETVSIPVYAIIATGIASAKFVQVGAVPQWMFAERTCGLKMSANPTATSRSWVAKSTTARKTLRLAASLIPTTFRTTRKTITIAPPITSQGVVRSGPQKIERECGTKNAEMATVME